MFFFLQRLSMGCVWYWSSVLCTLIGMSCSIRHIPLVSMAVSGEEKQNLSSNPGQPPWTHLLQLLLLTDNRLLSWPVKLQLCRHIQICGWFPQSSMWCRTDQESYDPLARHESVVYKMYRWTRQDGELKRCKLFTVSYTCLIFVNTFHIFQIVKSKYLCLYIQQFILNCLLLLFCI